MDAVIMMTSLKKRRDKASVFLLFVNKAETTSSSLSLHPQRTLEGEMESMASVGCLTMMLVIS